MKITIKSLSLLFSFLLIFLSCIGCSLSDKKETASRVSVKYDGSDEIDPDNIKLKGEFIIGATGPLTGAAAIYGTAVKNGAQMAIDEINAAGGLFGAKFKLNMLDDMQSADTVSANYAALKKSGMQISLGSVTSEPCAKFAQLAKEDNLLIMTPSASKDKLVEEYGVYQMCYSNYNQGSAAADYINKNYLNATVGVLYNKDDDFSKGAAEKFKIKADESIKIIDAPFDDKTYTFAQIVPYLQGCDIVFMPIYSDDAAKFIYEAHYNLLSCSLFLGTDSFDGVEHYLQNYDIPELSQEIAWVSYFDIDALEGPAADFIYKYTDKYGTDSLNQFAASAYDSVYALYGAMKLSLERGDIFTPESSPSKICNILKETLSKRFKFTGITGAYKDYEQTVTTWDSKGFAQKEPVIFKIDLPY